MIGCTGVGYELDDTEKKGKDEIEKKRQKGQSINGFSIRAGLFETEAIDLLKEFYARGNPNAPDTKRHRAL